MIASDIAVSNADDGLLPSSANLRETKMLAAIRSVRLRPSSMNSYNTMFAFSSPSEEIYFLRGGYVLRTVETISGSGRLVGSACNAKVSYDIFVLEEQIPVATLEEPSATIPGLKKLNVALRFADSKQIPLSGENVTLHLEDGRKLSLFRASNTDFQANGGLF